MHNPSQVESGSIRWLYCTKSGRQVPKVTVITENLFLEHRRAQFFIFPKLPNVSPQPQTKPKAQKIFQSKVTPFRKWPHRPVLVCMAIRRQRAVNLQGPFGPIRSPDCTSPSQFRTLKTTAHVTVHCTRGQNVIFSGLPLSPARDGVALRRVRGAFHKT